MVKNSLEKRNISIDMEMPKIHTDNVPQFIARQFEQVCEDLGVIHERISVEPLNMNAHIEAFHSILQDECYDRHEFDSFVDVYSVVGEYMRYYNTRRRHGSLKCMTPEEVHEAFLNNVVNAESFPA